MITVAMARIVVFCARHAAAVIVAFLLLTILCGVYTAKHFAINTNTENMLSPDLPWRKQEIATNRAFPQRTDLLIAVIDGVTPEKAEAGAAALAAKLAPQTRYFKSVRRPDGGPFFAKNGILFGTTAEVESQTQGLIKAQAFLGSLAVDPTLRGIMGAFSQGLLGVRKNEAKLDDLERPFTAIAEALEQVEAGGNPAFSWRAVLNGDKPKPEELRKFLMIQPVLDFSALQPGEAATKVIRDTAVSLGLTPENGVRLRLTGQVALADEEFGTVKEGFLLNGIVTVLVVVFLLWLALKQARIILSVFLSLVSGLLITAALGLFLVGSLNLLSIAFAVLFVGLGVDFGIQFSVRYRSERHAEPDLQKALKRTAIGVGGPLLLAAASTAAGFLSFWPTDYLGLSELGKIAGMGMVVAFLTSIMLLPALLALLKPKGETAEIGFKSLAIVDHFLETHSFWIVGLTLGVVVLASPLLLKLQFDFNPLDLNSTSTESVSTLFDLGKNPKTNTNTIDVLLPNAEAAEAMATKLKALPTVSGVHLLQSFVPADQDAKLDIVQDANNLLGYSLNPSQLKPAPTDAETVAALRTTAKDLADTAGDAKTPAAEAATRLSKALAKLAGGDAALRGKASDVLVTPLKMLLDQVRDLLQADKVTVQSLPDEIKRDWMTPDGQMRLEISPNSTTSDNEFLRRFADDVLSVAPMAVGGPVFISAAADSIIKAFWEAGLWAVGSIAVILFIVLRRIPDVLLTLVPLMIAIVLTLELCVILDWQLNYANIIALPLLLGVGVAFKIYYVMAWRSGEKHFLQLSLTRAVLFSAMATATAFGSLWLSHHPGTSSMGKLMALALVTTLAAATLFQPALLATRKHT